LIMPFILAAVGVVVVVMTATSSPAREDLTSDQRRDVHQLAQYRAFAYATNLYLKANPTYVGTLTWAGLKVASTTPPSMRNAQMHHTFKAVIASSTDYVICGELPERAATAITQFMPDSVKTLRATSTNKMVFAADQAEADSLAARCT